MASTVVELLRRRFGGKKEVDPYADWVTWDVYVASDNVERSICAGAANMFDRMLINDEEVTPISSKTFAQRGTYHIKGHFKNNVTALYTGFLNAAHYRNCVIPNLVTNIGSNGFRNFASNVVTYIVCKSTTPPHLDNNVFLNSRNVIVYVPDESVNTYKTEWAQYSGSNYGVAGIKPISEKTD